MDIFSMPPEVIGPNGSWRALDGRHSPVSAEEQKRIKAAPVISSVG